MIRCRDASEADAALLADLFARSFTETFGHLYRPEDLAAFLARMDETGWLEELADPAMAVRIAEEDGSPAAFAKVGPLTVPVGPVRPAIELRQLYVLKPWQGLGIAETLIEWALGRASAMNAEEVYLSVYVDNHRACRFDERYGFQYAGRYHFMVGEQADDELIMRLALED